MLFFGGSGRVHHVAMYLGGYKIVEARQSGTKIMVSALSSHDDFYEAYRPAVSGTAQPDSGGNAYVWATNVNVRASATTTASKVWSKIAEPAGYISNVYIKGPAKLPNLPAC